MLTRLRVSGFKNLVDVDVRFGAFTCIAGINGVGKSNLFDAIHFLSLLAGEPLIQAALKVRGGQTSGVRSLFHRTAAEEIGSMTFDAEMIVPRSGDDDLGQQAEATTTLLRYRLVLGYRAEGGNGMLGGLEILREELQPLPRSDAPQYLHFPHSAKLWRSTALVGKRRGAALISTDGEGEGRQIRLHQDGGSRGRPLNYLARNLPRTVLSSTNASESPTALLARREMQSWRILQLEPSNLRQTDAFTAPQHLSGNGLHLAATLYRLARPEQGGEASKIYAQLANRVAELVPDVRRIWVDKDERREQLSLQVEDRSGTFLPGSAMSDGSLRFLALAVLELDPEAQGLWCLEEPENGIHPERVAAMLRLLQEISVDVTDSVDDENPLRQVIINTHSPLVVAQVPRDGLLLAMEERALDSTNTPYKHATFRPLPDTWRTRISGAEPVPVGKMISYLAPISLETLRQTLAVHRGTGTERRVVEDESIQKHLFDQV